MSKLFTVTLTDLGEYRVTVAADDEESAVSIAKGALLEEAVAPCPGMKIAKREIAGTAALSEQQPIKTFRVNGTHTIEFHIDVPANDRDEAKRHARRLYESEPHPWEYANDGGNVQWGYVEEACS